MAEYGRFDQESLNQFISVWKTDESGTTTDTQIRFSLSNVVPDVIIDWGDNSETTISSDTSNITHDYGATGIYPVTITGECRLDRLSFAGDQNKILEILHFGQSIKIGLNSCFFNCSNLTFNNVDDVPNLKDNNNSLELDWFLSCSSLTTINNVSNWNTRDVEEILFADSQFDGDLSNWDTSQIINMTSAFRNTSFNNGGSTGIGNWDVSKVVSFSSCFENTPFNQPIGNWKLNTNSDINIRAMFLGTDFNQDISNWDVSRVTDMSSLFQDTSFNNGGTGNTGIGNWDVSNVVDMGRLFFENKSFSQPIVNWDVSSVVNFNLCFQFSNFNQPIGNWQLNTNTEANIDMQNMFFGTDFNQDISNWNTNRVTSLQYAFGNTKFNNGGSTGIDNWDVSNVTNMIGVFSGSSFNQPIGNWNTSSVTNMASMFQNTTSFDQDISNWGITALNPPNALQNFMSGVELSTENYDALLISWDNQVTEHGGPVGMNANFGLSDASPTGPAAAAKDSLVINHSWTITDGAGTTGP